MAGTSQRLVGLARDWLEFRKYKGARKKAARQSRAGTDDDPTTDGQDVDDDSVRHGLPGELIGLILIAAVSVIVGGIFSFSNVHIGSLVGGETVDPTSRPSLPSFPTEPIPTSAPPPDMSVASAYKNGYFIDPVTGDRYLVVRIGKKAKVPSGWFCEAATELATRRCLMPVDPSVGDGKPSADRPADKGSLAPGRYIGAPAGGDLVYSISGRSVSSDPRALELVPPGAPPDMSLESAYSNGYFTDPRTGYRYLVTQIDKMAKVPTGWFCRAATGLPTRQCLMFVGPAGSDAEPPAEGSADEGPLVPDADADTSAPRSSGSQDKPESATDGSDGAPESGGSSDAPWWVVFGAVGGGLGGLAALGAVAWQMFKDRGEFREWRRLAKGERRELLEGERVLFSSPVEAEAEVADTGPRRPSVEGNDLGAPL